MASKHHNEWKDLVSNHEGFGLLKYLLEDIVEPVLNRNQYYRRCQAAEVQENRGICLIMREFKSYIESDQVPPSDRLRLFGELAYTIWLLTSIGDKKYEVLVQRRINQFFVGSEYFGPGIPGFRQFEYELQVLSRLIEEEITFIDDPGEGEPDLLVSDEQFRLEVKLPTANALKSLEKAVAQLGSGGGCVVISLDNILASASEEDKEDLVDKIARQLYEKIKNRPDISVVIEFYRNDNVSTAVAWIGCAKNSRVAVTMHALTGIPYTQDTLPEPINSM